MSRQVLVVEDELTICQLLQYNLETAGYKVQLANSGDVGFRLALTSEFDFIILDVMLPQMDGFEICRKLRQEGVQTPILMLTAKSEEYDRILGLEFGADDYLTKPFSPREVVARVKAVLRRTEVKPDNVMKMNVGALAVFPDRFDAYLYGEKLDLTVKEFELLAFFCRNRKQVFSRQRLLDAVWGSWYDGDIRVIDIHVSRLRDKIEKDTKKPCYLKTVRGIGYKFDEPDTNSGSSVQIS